MIIGFTSSETTLTRYHESKEDSYQVTGLVKISVVLSPFDSSFRDGYFQSVEIFLLLLI